MDVLDVVVLSTATAGLMALVSEVFKKFLLTLPQRLLNYLVMKMTVSVKFTNTEPAFDMIKQWLAQHPYSKKVRQVKLVWSHAENKYVTAPGYGTHYLWYNRMPLIITYGEEKRDNNQNMWSYTVSADESYTVKFIGRDHTRLHAFLQDISCFKREDKSKIRVYSWKGYWQSPGPRRKREMNTVYMPTKVKQRIIDDIQSFIENEAWYLARGIPYRRGYLFYGPPGTGKTTLATALAGYFDRPIYCLNLNSIHTDENLINAFSSVPSDGIVLMEDVDAFDVSNRRDDEPAEETPTADTKPGELKTATLHTEKKKMHSLTISGLLNAIDGVVATEGRILIMTTNHLEKLDPALVRSGRVDSRIEIGALDEGSVEEMFMCFYPQAGALKRTQIRAYASRKVMTAANWQELFIRYHDSEERLLDEVVLPYLRS